MTKKVAVSVKNLTKVFNKSVVAVDEINLDVFEGEVVGLLGPNGSGKTTTQRMLSSVLKPSRGDISYFGKRLHSTALGDRKIRHLVGYVPQKDSLYDDLSVWDNILFFSQPYDLKSSTIRRRAEKLIDELELKKYRDFATKDLSGGYRKRASIACSLVHRPKVVYLDEVTMGLDPNSRYHIWDLIKELKKRATIVMTTHYMDEAMELCDRIVILSKGQIMATGKPKYILDKYQSKNLNEVIAKVIEAEG